MTQATLHLELRDRVVFACVDGRGWAVLDRIAAGGSLHDISYEAMRRLGAGAHPVDVDLRVPSVMAPVPSEGDERDAIQEVDYSLFEYRVGCLPLGGVLSAIAGAFNERTADAILALLDADHLAALRQYVSELPPGLSGAPGLPGENLAALRGVFS